MSEKLGKTIIPHWFPMIFLSFPMISYDFQAASWSHHSKFSKRIPLKRIPSILNNFKRARLSNFKRANNLGINYWFLW